MRRTSRGRRDLPLSLREVEGIWVGWVLAAGAVVVVLGLLVVVVVGGAAGAVVVVVF